MFNNKLTKKVLSITSAIAIMGAMAIPSLAAAAKPVTGQTNVFYTSENIIPGPEGSKWGVKIPTGVSFTNGDVGKGKTGPQYNIELVSLDADRKGLDKVYAELKITAEVESANGFKFAKQNANPSDPKVGSYSYKADNNLVKKAAGKQTLPELTQTKTSITGEFTLDSALTEKGQYTDVLTYTFTQTAARFN